MRHRRARLLLPELLDAALPRAVEENLREHLTDCRRCQSDLAELRATEKLLARLPPSLVPQVPTPAAEARLAGLARWAADPPLSWSERVGVPALGACAAAAMLVMLLSTAGLMPPLEPPSRTVTLAAVMPEARLLPTGVR